ncbi:MAG: CYTH domain-containing protein [Ginsengibacter sp.]
MSKEIERKFIVDKEKWNSLEKPAGLHYTQGYLCVDAEKSIRIRITDSKSFITIKGKLKKATREEYEYDIPVEDAKQMIENLSIGSIFKIRFTINVEKKLWVVDEFLGKNEDLLLAEIELKNVDEQFTLPEWVGKEVTDDDRYYNANLVSNPYENWKHEEENSV